jgi:two-component system, NarL family, response regulator NreC
MNKYVSVLVADDNDSFRAGFIELINNQNRMKVVGEAKDGIETINLATILKPELVMIDVSMPKMDGIACAQLIKKQSQNTFVVIMTIHEESIFKVLADSLPADGFICKSSISHDLPKVLKKLFPKLAPDQTKIGPPMLDVT